MMNSLQKLLPKYPDKPWNWGGLSSNPNITFDFVEKYPDKPWDWYILSCNSNITFDIVEKYPGKPWSWNGLSFNPNITFDIVEKYPDKPWDWYGLSRNTFEGENRNKSALKIQRAWKRWWYEKDNEGIPRAAKKSFEYMKDELLIEGIEL